MGSESNLKAWVSDKLMALLGYSMPVVVEQVIELTKKANSPASVVDKLVELGLSSSTETGAFAEEIFARVCGKTSGLKQCQIKKRFRKRAILDEKDGNDDDGVIAQAEKKRVKRRNSPDKGDRENGSESEEERLRDQREKEQLEQNIRKRDAAATRKVAKKNLRRKEEEEAVRKTSADIEGLRRASRQQYLKKRVQKKLDEIRDDIEDVDYLFKLTESEYRELGIKKQILGLVKF